MTIVDLPLTYTRDELIAVLTERRKTAAAKDAEALAEHRKAERAHLAEFRAACRQAVKWSYEEAKNQHFDPRVLIKDGRYGPSCPRSEASRIDSLLAVLAKTKQQRFTLSRNGQWHDIYALLTDDVPSIKGLC